MKTTWKSNFLIGFYFSILFVLLLCVSITPIMIKNGLTMNDRFIVEEDILETAMILVLFCISFLTLIRFMNRLKAYRQAVERAIGEKSRLLSRLVEAFRYIGIVNVEIKEIESVLCGVKFYPQSKKEFRHCVDQLLSKAVTIAAIPWLVVRMIDRHSKKTVNEQAVQRPRMNRPTVTIGNRAVLEARSVDGIQTIRSRQQNLDLLTVFILPATGVTDERTILLCAILNQIEMIFMLHRAGCFKPTVSTELQRKNAPQPYNQSKAACQTNSYARIQNRPTSLSDADR